MLLPVRWLLCAVLIVLVLFALLVFVVEQACRRRGHPGDGNAPKRG